MSLLPEVDLQGVSWHQHKHIIAFLSGSNQVIVRDYEDSGKFFNQNMIFSVSISRLSACIVRSLLYCFHFLLCYFSFLINFLFLMKEIVECLLIWSSSFNFTFIPLPRFCCNRREGSMHFEQWLSERCKVTWVEAEWWENTRCSMQASIMFSQTFILPGIPLFHV